MSLQVEKMRSLIKKTPETKSNNAKKNAILLMGNKENYEYSRRTFGEFSQKNSCR
jgi:hypothetical protein